MAKYNIEIFSTPTCPDCRAAKEFLSQHDITFTEHNIEDHQGEMEQLIKLTGKHIVPTIKINDQLFIGFSENREEIEKLLLQTG